jgi:hypothetical protein
MCTFMTLPCFGVGGVTSGILWCVGEGSCCCNKNKDYNKDCQRERDWALTFTFTRREKWIHLGTWLLVFFIGLLGMFLPLSLMCAEADGVPWSSFEWWSKGECWSTGGSMPGRTLGAWAGIFCGVGAGGFFVTLCRCPNNNNNNNKTNDPASGTCNTDEKDCDVELQLHS